MIPFTYKNINFSIETHYEINKYYCKTYCMKCNYVLIHETNNYNTETQAINAAKHYAREHAFHIHSSLNDPSLLQQ